MAATSTSFSASTGSPSSFYSDLTASANALTDVLVTQVTHACVDNGNTKANRDDDDDKEHITALIKQFSQLEAEDKQQKEILAKLSCKLAGLKKRTERGAKRMLSCIKEYLLDKHGVEIDSTTPCCMVGYDTRAPLPEDESISFAKELSRLQEMCTIIMHNAKPFVIDNVGLHELAKKFAAIIAAGLCLMNYYVQALACAVSAAEKSPSAETAHKQIDALFNRVDALHAVLSQPLLLYPDPSTVRYFTQNEFDFVVPIKFSEDQKPPREDPQRDVEEPLLG